jgi:hypothetical protein
MKVCIKHIHLVRRGTTYQVVPESECIVCQTGIDVVEEVW